MILQKRMPFNKKHGFNAPLKHPAVKEDLLKWNSADFISIKLDLVRKKEICEFKEAQCQRTIDFIIKKIIGAVKDG